MNDLTANLQVYGWLPDKGALVAAADVQEIVYKLIEAHEIELALAIQESEDIKHLIAAAQEVDA